MVLPSERTGRWEGRQAVSCISYWDAQVKEARGACPAGLPRLRWGKADGGDLNQVKSVGKNVPGKSVGSTEKPTERSVRPAQGSV